MEVISGAKTADAYEDALINEAINGLNVNFMRGLLKALCHVPAAREVIQKKLLTTADKAVPEQTESEDEELSLDASIASDASNASDEESDGESEIQVISDGDETGSEGDGSGDENEKAAVTTKKRKASIQEAETRPSHLIKRWAACENCGKLFDVTVNEKRACIWHLEGKIVDYESDMWCDHDPNCHGDYEDFEDDEDFARGFIWSCCERRGDSKGCMRGMHHAAASANKRARY